MLIGKKHPYNLEKEIKYWERKTKRLNAKLQDSEDNFELQSQLFMAQTVLDRYRKLETGLKMRNKNYTAMVKWEETNG
jgi:hypothetical protein